MLVANFLTRGEKRKKSEKKIENGKGANEKTYLIGCEVDAAPIEAKKFMKPRSER